MPRPVSAHTAEARKLAKVYGCDEETIRNWTKAGAPLHSRKKMAAWLEERGNIGSDELEPGDLKAAKLAKIKAETKRILFKLKVEEGDYTHNDEIARVSVAWAAQVRAELMALKSEAPTWAGLSPAELQDKADQFIVMALGRLQTFYAPIQHQDSK